MKKVECRLIEVADEIKTVNSIRSVEDAYSIIKSEFEGLDREACVVVTADIESRPISISRVALGSLESVAVSCRELFKVALLDDAKRILIAHNHTNGNVNPSKEDLHSAEVGIYVANALGIGIIDQLIIYKDRVYSMNNSQTYKMIEKENEY